MPEAGEKESLQTEDRKWTGVRRSKEFIMVVFGAPREADARELIQAAENNLGHR
jgi:hypothetical protein